MTTITKHQKVSENWRKYLASLDERIDEGPVYKFTGTPIDPSNPNSKWDPKSVKKTLVGADPRAPIKGYEKEETKSILEKVGPVIVAAGFGVAAIVAAWGFSKLLKFKDWVVGLGMRALGKGGAGQAALRASGSLSGRIASGLRMFFGVGFVAKAAIITAVGYSIYKAYKLFNPSVAVATDNPKGPGTKEFIKSIEKGKNALSMRSWIEATNTPEGRKLQCRWCKANPGREFPTVKNNKGAWVKAKKVDRPNFWETFFTSKKDLNKKKIYKDATEKTEMPSELKKIFDDIKENGPFCKDILKRKDCIELKQGASKPSTSGGKKVSQSTQATSQEPLQGEVTTLKSVGIQHNLTGERKQMAEAYLQKMIEIGISNKYVLAGLLATSGKESGFVGKAEGARYGFERLKQGRNYSGNTAAASRTMKVFMHQLGRHPNEEEWRQLSKENGHKGGVALFNIAYGYEPVKKNGKRWYTTYQQEKAIPHTKRVITRDGVINPELYDENLAGYKYRGRGAIQITFKASYAAAAKAAKFSPEMQEKIIENPDLLITDPMIGVLMNAGVSKMSYNKTSRNMERSLSAGEPDNLLDGIRFGCLLAGGGGGSTTASWFNYAVNRALKVANDHIRIVGTGDIS